MTNSPTELQPTEAYALARAFVGLDYKNVPGIQNPIIKHLLGEDWAKPQTRQAAQIVLQPFMQQIFAVDPNQPPPAAKKLPIAPLENVFVPPLPEAARLSDAALKAAESAGHWYKMAVDWSIQRSPMTPHHFLRGAAAWTLGLCINRRVSINLHERIYPFLYYLIVAESSKYAKSTGMNTMRSLVNITMPHMLIPGSTTTEGLVELLSGQLPANYDHLAAKDRELVDAGRKFAGQRGVMQDEFSGLLAAMKKDYMAGFVELLMRLYDAQDSEQHHTRSGGLIIVRYPGISLFGATTPAALGRAVSYEQWENGLMARFFMMFREQPLPYNPNYIDAIPPTDLVDMLKGLNKVLPDIAQNESLEDPPPFNPISATFAPEAHKAYQAYTKAVFYDMLDDLDERIQPNYRRLHIQCVKIALGLATMDWYEQTFGRKGVPEISIGQWALAQQLTEEARESLHRLIPVLTQTHDTRTKRSIMQVLVNYPEGLTVGELGDKCGRNVQDVKTALSTLSDAGMVEEITYQPHTGRPSKRFRWLGTGS